MILAHEFSSIQQAQFDELQTAWRHQCTADIRGNSSSFKLRSYRVQINILTLSSFICALFSSSSLLFAVNSGDIDLSNNECRISVPSLNMCFSTNKLQSLNVVGNIFDSSKVSRPLTLQDYIQILIDTDKHLDQELAGIIHSISSLVSRQKPVSTSTSSLSTNTAGMSHRVHIVDDRLTLFRSIEL
jgi:hypothetical protein